MSIWVFFQLINQRQGKSFFFNSLILVHTHQTWEFEPTFNFTYI